MFLFDFREYSLPSESSPSCRLFSTISSSCSEACFTVINLGGSNIFLPLNRTNILSSYVSKDKLACSKFRQYQWYRKNSPQNTYFIKFSMVCSFILISIQQKKIFRKCLPHSHALCLKGCTVKILSPMQVKKIFFGVNLEENFKMFSIRQWTKCYCNILPNKHKVCMFLSLLDLILS